MTNEEVQAWLGAFYLEHGFLPNEDPNLLDKGFSPEQSLAEHIYAMQWSQGKPESDYTQEWQRRYEPRMRNDFRQAETASPFRMTSRGFRASPAPRVARFLTDYFEQLYGNKY